MKLVNTQNRIQELMSRFVAQIEMAAAMSKTDLNKTAETILIPLLNEVYGWSLQNINYAEENNNYPSIDLADEVAGISIQVTATPTLDKVKHTLEQFTKHNQYLTYNRLIIYILKNKQNSYSEAAIQGIIQNKFNFNTQKDIWDCRDIVKEVSNFQIDKALKVQEILEKNFGGDRQLQTLSIGESGQKIDWQQVCRAMLDRQIQFPTLNDLMAKDGVRVDPAKLFVPVGLVERKQKQHRRSDVASTEQSSQLLQPIEEEIVQRFEHEEDFFSQVICNPEISSNSRLVITGEPGAGKTTLLQKIGDRLDQAGLFPVWVSLSKNGVPPTCEFLSHLLKENAQPQNLQSSDWDGNISALLQTGKVWLLLDGADELTTDGNPLQIIGTQLRESWASQVKVVLTCRLNAWDIYALPEFKVFRTLEFDYQTPVDGYQNQVEAYIHQFFAKEAVDPQLGDALIQKLHLPGKERICDSVKNPLRLALLCYIWEAGIGELPDTKAELYRLFVDYYYDLQALKHPEKRIDRTERDALNLALGEVAKAALDSSDSRFRLRKSLIESIPTMGKPDTKGSLFAKAIQLGWLNSIGTTAEKPHEAAYAFFHSTFQEYFAALAIDDWDELLPCNHKDEPVKNCKGEVRYRIFEPQWKEVILFWLGRNETEVKNEQKEAFMKALVDFQDGSGNQKVYRCKSYFLAVAGTSEYEFQHSLDVINQAFYWGYYFNEAAASSVPLLRDARSSIISADREIVIDILIKALCSKDMELQINAVKLVGTLHAKDPKVAETLWGLINTTDENVRCETAYVLAKVFKETEAIETLIKLLRSEVFDNAAQYLEELQYFEELNIDRSKLIAALKEVINSRCYDPFRDWEVYLVAQFLLRLEPGNLTAETALNYLSGTSSIKTIKKLQPSGNNSLEEALIHQLAELGIELDSSIMNTINSLINLICNSSDESVRNKASWCLEITVTGKLFPIEAHLFSEVIARLKACFDNFVERSDSTKIVTSIGTTQTPYMGCSEVLWYCAKNMRYPDFYQAWHSSSSATDAKLLRE